MKLSSFKKSTKNISFNIIFALGLIVIIAVLYKYNNNKFGKIDSFHTKSPIGSNLNEELYEEDNIINTNTKVSGIVTNPVKNGNISTNPNDLLPNNSNEWSDLNNVSKDLKNINLMHNVCLKFRTYANNLTEDIKFSEVPRVCCCCKLDEERM